MSLPFHHAAATKLALIGLSGAVLGVTSAATTPLHIFQTKPGHQLYTPLLTAQGITTRGDKLYYRQNTNANGTVLFDADQFGKDSVLLSATLGAANEVYVLANLQKGAESQSTVLKIRVSDKMVLNKAALPLLGLENVSPAGFGYDPILKAVKVNASKGYTTNGGIPSARYGQFWLSLTGTPKLVRIQLQ
ncbi:hypothetical protein [Deinococcus radiophilus]|uniref:Uncharacterized protein n=1 Tax=Deinococcus radiophilus TaxID=32062 RepID=A0A431W344_9DEIO|nr:hypothetical protein [Deinococcus radiophilus]RTR29848.1 hypothetical protein EJ104_02580 [Deinococcus radiophilus]UFA49800.1 hypothetical protein LMT64_07825 [Deinococcus radiophilus]